MKTTSAGGLSQNTRHVVFIPQPFYGSFAFRHHDWSVEQTCSSRIGHCLYVIFVVQAGVSEYRWDLKKYLKAAGKLKVCTWVFEDYLCEKFVKLEVSCFARHSKKENISVMYR